MNLKCTPAVFSLRQVVTTAIVCFLCLCACDVQAQYLTTVAGNGERRFMVCTGDGGPATDAELRSPCGVAVDGTGNIYIADYWNRRIRKVDEHGIITTFAGCDSLYPGDTLPPEKTSLANTLAVTVDDAGNVLFSHYHKLEKVDTNGRISVVAGGGGFGYDGDGGPAAAARCRRIYSVTTDHKGNIFIGTTSSVRKIDTNGIITRVAGKTAYGSVLVEGGPATDAMLYQVAGIAVDDAGNIYFSDRQNNRLCKVSVTGVVTTIAGDGERGFTEDGMPALGNRIDHPYGMALADNGTLFFSDGENHRVRCILPDGTLRTIAGTGHSVGPGPIEGIAGEIAIPFPEGLALDKAGSLYIADNGLSDRIRKVTNPVYLTEVEADEANLDIVSYPNPCSGDMFIRVETPANIEVSVVFTNVLGAVVKRVSVSSNTNRRIALEVPAGLYFLSVNLDGASVRKKVIVH